MKKIDVSNLKIYRSSFSDEKDKFNSSYSAFSSSYISTSSNSYVNRMETKLTSLYNLIKWGYINIDNWWQDYVSNAEALENFLADNGRAGTINKSNLRNFVNNHLQSLETYSTFTEKIDKFMNLLEKSVNGLEDLKQNVSKYLNSGLILFNSVLEESKNREATKKYIVEALGYDATPPEQMALGHIVYAIAGYDEQIVETLSQINKLNMTMDSLVPNNDMKEQNKKQITLLEEQYDELVKTKKLVIESLADYIGISKKELNEMLDYYDDANENEREQLIYCNIQLLNSEIKKTSTTKNTDKSLFATAATTVLTMGEKLLNKGEKVIDRGVFALTAASSLTTLGYDAFSAIKSKITGEKWTSKTKEMWKNSMEFISKEHVNEAFDKFYTETDVGSDLTAKTYGYNKIRSFGSSVNSELIGLSFAEGLGEFGEGLLDAATIAGTAYVSQYTALYDAAQAIGSKITGKEWTSKTEEMWDKTKKFVSVQYVDGAFNKLYSETKYGQNIVSRAYDFENIRAISSGIGYYSGAILLTVGTGGLGGLSTAASMGVSAGVAGLGKNTEKAWNEGATIIEGLEYGASKGLYEGVQMWAGAKINAFTPFKGASVSSQVKNTLTHVVFDGLDGLTSSFIDPGLQLIYSPNETNMDQIMYSVNYDENGNQINEKTWDDLSFGEKYTAMFNYSGGVEGAMINTFIGAGLSGITEVPDIGRAIKINNIVNNIDVNADITGSLLDQINNLKDDGLAKLITRCDETGKLSNVLLTLSNDKIASTLDQLDSNILKKIVGDDMSKYISYLDDVQMKGILDKINGDETLSNLKNQIETKLENKNFSKLNVSETKNEVNILLKESDESSLKVSEVNSEVGKSVSLLTTKNNLFTSLKTKASDSVSKLQVKLSKINDNKLVNKKDVTSILEDMKNSKNYSDISKESIEKLSKLNAASLATLINKLDSFDSLGSIDLQWEYAIGKNCSFEQLKLLSGYLDRGTYARLLYQSDFNNFLDSLNIKELNSITSVLQGNFLADIASNKLYSTQIIDNLCLTQAEWDMKNLRYNKLLNATNSEEYLNWINSGSPSHSKFYFIKTELDILKKELDNATITDLDDLHVEINHKFTDIELQQKINEYNELLNIAASDEYKRYIDIKEKGYAIIYNETYYNLTKEIARLKSELNYSNVIDDFIINTNISVYFDNLSNAENYSVLEIINIFKNNDAYEKLLGNSNDVKIKYGMATTKLFDMITENHYDLGLSNEQLLKMKNFADTYGNSNITNSVINNGFVKINLFSKGDETIKINTHELMDIISDSDKFDLFTKLKYGSAGYTQLFGRTKKFEYLLGIDQLYKLSMDSSLGFEFNAQQFQNFEILCKNYELERIADMKKWANLDMISLFEENYSSFVDKTKIESLKDTISFLDNETFIEFANSKYTAAFNGINGSVLNMKYSNEKLKSIALHESLHELSRSGEISGFDISEDYIGLNEAVTEYLTKSFDVGNFKSGYDFSVSKLRTILDMKIPGLDENTLKNAYFKNDITPVKDAIVKITDEKFFSDLLVAFNNSTQKGENSNLIKMISRLNKKLK